VAQRVTLNTNDGVWFDSMPDYIEIWLLYQFKKGASMGRTTHSTKVHDR